MENEEGTEWRTGKEHKGERIRKIMDNGEGTERGRKRKGKEKNGERERKRMEDGEETEWRPGKEQNGVR